MLFQNYNDETLVMLTLAGEQRAYEVLVARHEKAVIASALTVVGSKYTAEDAAQDAFITAWMKLDMLSEPKKYRSWVCRIANNCAKNILVRMRNYLSVEVLENVFADDVSGNPEALLICAEEKQQLHNTISTLSKKVKQVIHMYYFDELSIAEIADKMRVSEGTVKAQLHSGRKQLRNGLGAMDENANDTFVQKVMKKVEELKAWQFKNSKNGFETVYNDVLGDVEKLPESIDKYHALADALLRGWWWLPGEKNDALLARLRHAAELGKNDEAMTFIVMKEDQKWSCDMLIEFIRDKQIPRLEAAGFKKALAHEWFWLADEYFNKQIPDTKNGFAAYEKVLEISQPTDKYYAMTLAAIELQKQYLEKDVKELYGKYEIIAGGDECKLTDGNLRRFDFTYINRGWISSIDSGIDMIFQNASRCDGYFTINGVNVGEKHVGSDGTTLLFAADDEVVQTPCGCFENCELWITKYKKVKCKTYYKKGVGIVKQEYACHGYTNIRMLKAYTIVGGEGLIPCIAGNTWEYVSDYNPEFVEQSLKISVCHADETTVTLSYNISLERLKYDDNNWLDMISQIRSEYFREINGKCKVCDVYYPIERAQLLAKTPMERAHAKAACSVARRILETDPEFNPDYKASGHWNFFHRSTTYQGEGKKKINGRDSQWCFELKNTDGSAEQMPMLYNDIYGILQDGADCIWSDDWQSGVKMTVEYLLYGTQYIKTEVECEAVGNITTPAGNFENCLKLSLDIHGMSAGTKYRAGKIYYYFAFGVGIVRMEKPYFSDIKTAVYDLTEYEGTGEGYMPLYDGMMRRYEAQNLTDGYVGSVIYTYVADEDGDIVIFADKCGIREIGSPFTRYDSVFGEVLEKKFWESGNREEGWKYNSLNNLNIMLHFLCKPGRNTRRANRSIELNGFKMQLIEMFGENGDIPPAWHALYAWTALVRAAAFFGTDKKEEGYEHLEISYEYYQKWDEYEDGAELETGKNEMLGDSRIVKNRGYILSPDGTRHLLPYEDNFNANAPRVLYFALTACKGWEWFNKVREEDRFKEFISKAQLLK